MIKYNLKCKNKHEFESWFSDSKEFEKLLKKKLIECVFCKTKSVKKSIMSPRIASKKKLNFPLKEIRRMKKDLLKIRKFVEKNFDNVGKNKGKNIYGTASSKEVQELKDEGIELSTVPWVDNKEN